MSIFQNIPDDVEFECVKCNSCGCHYNGSENNRYGYFNCCYECGENKYEDERIIQEEKKSIFANLPNNLIMNIIKMAEDERKKEERELAEYNTFGAHFNRMHS